MGIRSNVDITVQIGRENNLANVAFDGGLQQLLDTLEHVQSGTLDLDASETNVVVPFGDVAQARIVYLEADGPIRVTPGGGIATSAALTGAGGSYPTGFVGAEHLDLEVDGVSIVATFEAGDQSLSQVINRINAAAALAGLTGPGSVPATCARDNGAGQLRIQSPTTGTSSVVEVLASSSAAALTALGLTATSNTGVNASPGQTPVTLLKPASTAGSDQAEGVKTYLLATLVTTALTLENLDSENAVTVTYMIAGDLVSSPPCDC